MTMTDPHVHTEMLGLIAELAEDWEYQGDITAETLFLNDLGLESLDLVVLGTMIQHRYGRMAFSELLADIGQRPLSERDITVGELVDYVCAHRAPSVPQPR